MSVMGVSFVYSDCIAVAKYSSVASQKCFYLAETKYSNTLIVTLFCTQTSRSVNDGFTKNSLHLQNINFVIRKLFCRM